MVALRVFEIKMTTAQSYWLIQDMKPEKNADRDNFSERTSISWVEINVSHTHKTSFWYHLRVTSSIYSNHRRQFYMGVSPPPSIYFFSVEIWEEGLQTSPFLAWAADLCIRHYTWIFNFLRIFLYWPFAEIYSLQATK